MADGVRLPFGVDISDGQRAIDTLDNHVDRVIDKIEAPTSFEVDVADGLRAVDTLESQTAAIASTFADPVELQIEAKSFLQRIKDALSASGDLKDEVRDLSNVHVDIPGLSTAWSDARKEAGEFSSAAQDALAELIRSGKKGSDEYDKLVTDIRKAAKEEAEFEKAAREAQKVFDNELKIHVDTEEAKSRLEELGERAAKIAGVAMTGSFLAGIGDEAAEVNQELRLLQGRTGLVGEDFERLRGIAENSFRNGVGGSIQEAIETATAAQKQFGNIIPEDQLQAATDRLGQLAAQTGEPVEDVAGKVRTLLASFPDLQGDVNKAFDLITLGAQKANTSQNDLLDTIAEYSKDFKGAGFSSEEMFSTFIEASQKGAFNLDKVGDSVKELGVRATEADITTELETAFTDFGDRIPAELQKSALKIGNAIEAGVIPMKDGLQAISQEIDKSGIDERMKLKLLRAFAGTPAEDLGQKIGVDIFKDFIPDAEIQAQAEEAGRIMGDAIKPQSVFQEWGRELEVVKTRALETIGPIISGFGDVAVTAGQVAPGISLASDKIKEMGGLSGVFGKLKGGISTLSSGFGNLAGSAGKFGSSLKSLATGPVGIIAGIAAVLVLAYNSSEDFRNAVDGLLSTLTTSLAPIADTLGELLTKLLAAVQPLLVTIGDLAGKLLTALMPAIQSILSVVGILLGAFGDVLGVILEGLTPVIGFLADVLAEVIEVAADLAAGLVEGLMSVLSDIGSFLQDVFIAAWDALVATMETVWDAISTVAGVVIDFYKWIGKAALTVAEFGADLLGLGGVFDSVVGWIGDAVDAVGDFISSIGETLGLIDDAESRAKKAQLASDEQRAAAASNVAGTMGAFVDAMGLGAKEVEQKATEIPDAISKGTKKGADKAKKDIKNEILDFADVVRAALRESENVANQLDITALGNSVDGIRAQNAERLRLLRQGIGDELEAIDKRIAEARAKEGKETTVTILNAEAARAALLQKQSTLEDQAQAELLKQLEGWYDQRLQAQRAATDAIVAEEERRLQIMREMADRGTLFGLDEAIRADVRLVEIELQRQLDAVVDTLPAFRAAKDQIVKALALGAIDQAEAERQIAAARQTVILEEGKKEGSLIALITAQNEEKRRQIIVAGIRDRRALEEQELYDSNALYRAALITRENLFQKFYDALEEMRNRDLSSELDAIATQKDAVLDAYLDQRIGRDELFSQMRELSQQENDLLAQRIDLWAAIAEGAKASLDIYGKDFQERAGQALANIDLLVTATDEELADLGFDATKRAEQQAEQLVDLTVSASAAIAAITAQQAIAGENILKSFANASLDIALQLLIKESKAVVALIFGKAVAANPLLGTLAAIPLIGAFSALVAIAKSAMSGGFYVGGYTGDGHPRDAAGVVHRSEFVMDHGTTRKYRPVFEDIHRGADPLTAALRHTSGDGLREHIRTTVRVEEIREIVRSVARESVEEILHMVELRRMLRTNGIVMPGEVASTPQQGTAMTAAAAVVQPHQVNDLLTTRQETTVFIREIVTQLREHTGAGGSVAGGGSAAMLKALQAIEGKLSEVQEELEATREENADLRESLAAVAKRFSSHTAVKIKASPFRIDGKDMKAVLEKQAIDDLSI